MRYTKNNIEDWDFFPPRDIEAELYLSENFISVVAVEDVRIQLVKAIVDKGWGEVAEDRVHIRLTEQGVSIVKYGLTSWRDLLSGERRFYRRIAKSLSREHEKYGQLRGTLLPEMPGFKGAEG